MPQYAYQAVDASNKRIKGTLPARNLEEAEAQIREMGYYPISVQAKSGPKLGGGGRKVTKKDLLSFTIQLHLMFTAGLPLLKSLQTIAEQEKNPKFRNIIADICKRIETTGSFSESIAAHPKVFPPFYLGAVKAGEAGSNLPDILEQLAVTLEKQDELQSELKQAMMYPMLIMVVMTCVSSFYAFYLMPRMMALVLELGAPLPIYTKVIWFIVSTLKSKALFILGLFIVGGTALLFYRRTETGAYNLSYMKLKFPLFGAVIQKSVLSNFSHYMSLLLGSGFNLLASLDLIKGTIGNKSIVMSIETMEERIRRGESLADSMRGLPFPGFMVVMIALGEQTGRVAEQLALVTAYFEKDVRRTTKRVLTLLEPLILVTFGGISAVILLSTFFPLYGAMGAVK
jgi:type IV pilus assembly protein PilC